MKHDNRPIGIFDSGLGGLTVAAALRRQLPGEHLIYLGDTARVPYGSKSKDTIVQFALEDAAFLLECEVKCVVAACNTVSALALEGLEAKWPKTPFIGVVAAGVTKVLSLKKLEHVLLLGTAATVNSDSYRKLIHRQRPEVSVRSVACPLFVPLVEEGWLEGEVPRRIAESYLTPALEPAPDALILGCTHYPLLTGLIREIIPGSVELIDSAQACAEAVERFLRQAEMTASGASGGTEQYFVTDMPASFFTLASRFLGHPLRQVDKVTIPPAPHSE